MKYTKEFKLECVNLMRSGISALSISKQTGVSRVSLAKWDSEFKDEFNLKKAEQILKDKIQILGSIADETLNLEVSDIGIEGRIAVSEIHPESIRFYKHINDNNKIISICEYKNKKE